MSFTAFKSEGGLLPADMLDQIATGAVVGQRAPDFQLDKNRRLTDEIAAAWSDARDLWKIYQRALGRLRASDNATTATRDWIVGLLRLLGYDELIYTAGAAMEQGRTYSISHWVDGPHQGAPVHIVGCRVDMDKKDVARLSPNALVQEYLNRTERLWGVVTNGYFLRVLRDSEKLSRPAYLEIDLKQIMEGDKFADFSLLYRLLHRTRLPGRGVEPPACLLEQYYQEVQKVGGRVRERLRDGVEQALKELGTGFLTHPANEELRRRLATGELSELTYYRQLLRLIYRMLFLMVAEERKLVGPDVDSPHWEIYIRYYSVSRLRELADRFVMGAERYSDQWRQLRATFRLFRSEVDGKALQVPPLDGDLFGPETLPDLEQAEVSNHDFITAIRRLSLYEDDRVLRRVNYGALDVEELGSVYESLLEYKPHVRRDGDGLEFELVPGSERRATGSYYTHPDLVHDLIVHALDPVIEERKARGKTAAEQEKQLLSITVCDPACGSGHFLLAAARRIAGELAQLRAGENQVTPALYRKSLRDVIQHCIYGVDLNPLAVDLCKVALWLEALNKGLPLNFLDHRIRCGNSLVGCTPEMLQKGIPDEAYAAINGDDKQVASALKKRNKAERKQLESGHVQLSFSELRTGAGGLASQFSHLDELGEESTDQVHIKAKQFEAARAPGTEWYRQWTACNLWTAAFFLPKDSVGAPVPTTETVSYFLNGLGVEERAIRAANGVAEGKHFFHWHLEFPEVIERGGFDCFLGNPPFVAGRNISGTAGDRTLSIVKCIFPGTAGQTDLSAYFLRRAYEHLVVDGILGLIATNSISQGDSRVAGLQRVVDSGGTIVFAVSTMTWPGEANLEVAVFAIRKGLWNRKVRLNGNEVPFISPMLNTVGQLPEALLSARGRAFTGNYVGGLGFVLSSEQAQSLRLCDTRNADVIFPYIIGDDLNNRVDQSPGRLVINFKDWPQTKAQSYPDVFHIVETKVKPERQEDKREARRKRWWLHAERSPGLYDAIAGMSRVLACSRVSKYWCVAWLPAHYVYDQRLVVFAIDRDAEFAVLQSNIHELWAVTYRSTLRKDPSYLIKQCFETFPMPAAFDPNLDLVGKQYDLVRRKELSNRGIGLTKLYNTFHQPTVNEHTISILRDAHAEMDRAVLTAYGWSDINLAHDFYVEGAETRFTISPEAKNEVLRRLLDLNRQQAAEEKAQGK